MGYKYSDPVAWIDEDSKKDVLAAYYDGYMKPLVISDHGIPEKTPVEASVIYPTGSTTEEQKQVVDRAEQRNLKVIQAVIGAQCCVEHYRSQKVIGTEDIFVVTVEVYKEYTAVSLLKAEGSAYYIKDTARIPLRAPAPENEHRFLYHMAMNVNRIKYKNGINPALHPAMKVVLAGSFWNETTHVKYMEERLTDCKVFSYKPAHALTLGGCLFLRKYGKRHPVRVFYDEFVYAQCTLPLSHLETLSPERQEEYWRKIRAVSQKDEKFYIQNYNAQDYLDVYESIQRDYPCFSFYYEYGSKKTILTTEVQNGKCVTVENIAYPDKCGWKLQEIEQKADEIIRTCINGKALSDDEIVAAVYSYMTKHYEYTKEARKNGQFPENTYSIECLLSAGVCSGYSLSMVFILRNLLQIPASYVSGECIQTEIHNVASGNHAWNVIETPKKLGCRYYDLTFDLGKSDFGYYALDETQMRSRGHFIDGNERLLCACR